MTAAMVFLAVGVLVLGVANGKPYGWLAAGLAVLAILSMLIGWPR